MEKSQEYSLKDLSKHNNEKDCWIALHGNVYNLTEYYLFQILNYFLFLK